MKLSKLSPLLLLGVFLVKQDTSACTEGNTQKDAQEKTAKVLAHSARKALKKATAPTEELHPDFMIGNFQFRF